jgi:hypothetical protein
MARAGRLPNLVIAGVNKAGTTSLFTYLSRHPAVCGSTVKETCHFLPLRYGQAAAPLDQYRAFFPACGDAAVVMEATPGYFYGGGAVADEIRSSVPGVKVVVVLREPVARLVSFYQFQKSRLTLPYDLTLDEYVAGCDTIEPERFSDPGLNPWFGVQGGYYHAYLPAWIDAFGTDLRVLYFDELVGDPRRTVLDLAAWLEVDPEPFADADFITENRTVAPRKPSFQRAALAVNRRLEATFRSHPRLKKSLRAVYYRANTGPAVAPSAELRRALIDRYADSRQSTADQLRKAGLSGLPSWLTGATPTGPAR